MLKRIILIAAMVPTAASAHDFNQEQFLQRWLDNRINIGTCLQLTATDIDKFREECDLDTMVSIENKMNARLKVEMLTHPLDDALTFTIDHWADEDEEYIWGVYLNIDATPQFKGALLQMYVIQGLTRNYTEPDTPEGRSSTVDE